MNAPPPTDVWLAPYLRLTERVRVGPWEAIPAQVLELDDCTSQHALEQVRGLLDVYRRPRRVHEGFGCFLRRGDARIGESFRHRDVWTMRRALLIGALERNSTPWRAPLENPNWGWATWTSDSLFLVWHRIDPGGWVSARYGWLISNLEGGLTITRDHDGVLPPSEIAPPAEQPFPFMAPTPDADYANVLFDTLVSGDARAPRLAAAIDWLDLAWRNTTSINADTRVLLLKAGFEALLAAGHTLPPQRAALAALLGSEAGRRRWRTPVDRYGNPLPRVQMTDVEWWYTRFTWLRNGIAHGRRLTGNDWKHGRVHHYWLGDHWLRAAIRFEVAAASGRDYFRESDEMSRWALRYIWQTANDA